MGYRDEVMKWGAEWGGLLKNSGIAEKIDSWEGLREVNQAVNEISAFCAKPKGQVTEADLKSLGRSCTKFTHASIPFIRIYRDKKDWKKDKHSDLVALWASFGLFLKEDLMPFLSRKGYYPLPY